MNNGKSRIEKAAQVLFESKYANEYWTRHGNWYVKTDTHVEQVDPFGNARQLFALAHWFLFPDKTLTLTGDGHFNVKEQLQNFVRENLSHHPIFRDL